MSETISAGIVMATVRKSTKSVSCGNLPLEDSEVHHSRRHRPPTRSRAPGPTSNSKRCGRPLPTPTDEKRMKRNRDRPKNSTNEITDTRQRLKCQSVLANKCRLRSAAAKLIMYSHTNHSRHAAIFAQPLKPPACLPEHLLSK